MSLLGEILELSPRGDCDRLCGLLQDGLWHCSCELETFLAEVTKVEDVLQIQERVSFAVRVLEAVTNGVFEVVRNGDVRVVAVRTNKEMLGRLGVSVAGDEREIHTVYGVSDDRSDEKETKRHKGERDVLR